jgi:hypothetical protein
VRALEHEVTYRHDPECERYRDLPTGEMNACSYCLIAIGARAEGWYDARRQILEAAKSLPLTTDEMETVEMVVQLAYIQTPRAYFYPKAKRPKTSKKGKT